MVYWSVGRVRLLRTKHKEYLSLVIAVLLLEAILLILIQLHEKPISNSGVTILCLCPYLLIRFVTFILNIGKMAKLMVMSLVVGIEVFTVSVFLSGLNADNLLLACAVFLYCVLALQQNSRKDSKWLWGRVILCFLLLEIGRAHV